MERIYVSSTSLQSVGYDDQTQTLEVEFTNGLLYQYFDVSPAVYAELVGASSIGQYFAQNIRNSYRYSRI
ncbi:KTSC domain-containing protein [Mycolicibacterium conceptionense]|uniref:KTSC domain-containing protein n=1 Tax=Mycolicibacterium conceptionense TaxID=451644 RepID=A0A1A1YTI2_9MYCO|nr:MULTISPECIES: KTSC domain-containing protein [Mycolicibacterium]MCW1825146.1 KTSC domain-containing protein [Mycolicibacterium senegalense]OBB04550.1 KTSC domain-containing protein [Mycolicibacterium conceptionense]OBE93837.1 KTSC domain-containing protein [Mycolicibacterium conceptionense]OBF15163.1 KTSC domain-containing protein [Mycolicibacterium conceptionense]OBF34627.1 KTSC domain-containing protein [Mycolicibacterium conceptionense]